MDKKSALEQHQALGHSFFHQRIVNELRPEKIILFGSYGYGSPSEDSDVDLLVIMETSRRPAV